MKTLTANLRRTAFITTALTLACLATLARGASPAAPIITPAVDAATLAKAKAKGDAMQAKPKWKAELKGNGVESMVLYPAGDVLLCVNRDAQKHDEAHTTVLDSKTGRTLWETFPKGIPGSAIWSDGGLLGF